MDIDEKSYVEEQIEKVPRPPPIIIDKNFGFKEIMQYVGSGFNFKRISIGTKVLSPSIDKYNDLLNKLKTSKYTYHNTQSE